jgi:hypothetical protein
MAGFADRFTGVGHEPLTSRSPLFGLFKNRPVPPSLTAALAPIREAIAAGELAIDMAELDAMQQSCEELAQGKVDEGDPVPKHFIASVTMYTAEFHAQRSVYSVVNELLRDANRKKLKPVLDFVWLLMHALSMCPPFKGHIAYRGVKGLQKGAYKNGLHYSWFQFSSTAATVEVQTIFLGGTGRRTLFTLELTTGQARLISQYSFFPNEDEVLLPANSRFLAVSTFDAGADLETVQLREVAPSDPILRFGPPPPPSPSGPAAAPAVVPVPVQGPVVNAVTVPPPPPATGPLFSTP